MIALDYLKVLPMLMEFSYSALSTEVFVFAIIAALSALFAYRLIATAFFPNLCDKDKGFYLILCLLLLFVTPVLPPLNEESRRGEELFVMLLLCPSFVVGALELIKKIPWYNVLISCVLEVLLLPYWFLIVSIVGLVFFDDAD
jgi:hypothetical protein